MLRAAQQTDTSCAKSRNLRPAPIIRTRGLRRIYEMGGTSVHALDGIDLDIFRGTYCSIMGPSGSGKSTLMNVIGCLDSADDGEYWLEGEKVREFSSRQLAQVRNVSIGFVFQTFNLLPNATAIQNVELPLVYAGLKSRDRQRKASDALSQVGLSDRIRHKPGQLSGGQRQRVAIARALVTAPSILLADEPTGNLDSATADEIMELFHSLHVAGNTIVTVTHDEAIARHADRTIRMLDGRIVADSQEQSGI